MEREIIHIDEELCNGCGDCVPSCHEGALQVIDDKVRLISDLMCDGLGACLGTCPMDAITIEKREAEPYNEVTVMENMAPKGKNVVVAHLKHLKEHGETTFLKEGVQYLQEHEGEFDFSINEIKKEIHMHEENSSSGCPGGQTIDFGQKQEETGNGDVANISSELRQWPVQMHLINPMAPYFQNADVVIAADCTAYSIGNFHQKYLKGKSIGIACPKLDSNMEIYAEKIRSMIDDAKVNTLTVMIMEVPCCGGLLQLVQSAAAKAERKVPIKAMVVGLQGGINSEEWMPAEAINA